MPDRRCHVQGAVPVLRARIEIGAVSNKRSHDIGSMIVLAHCRV